MVGIWSQAVVTNFIAAHLCLKDQVVPSNLVFRFAAIGLAVCKIRPFEGESAESAKSAKFAFSAEIADMSDNSNTVGIEKLDKNNY